jgi:hypothetical protein
MAKFYGKIGYIKTVEIEPGVWQEQSIERDYYGDVIRNISKYQMSDKVNDDINLSNTFSIISDPFASENFQHMRYIVYMGTKWKISNVEVQYPRLLISTGGVYNE